LLDAIVIDFFSHEVFCLDFLSGESGIGCEIETGFFSD
jgi:hypothetical protein